MVPSFPFPVRCLEFQPFCRSPLGILPPCIVSYFQFLLTSEFKLQVHRLMQSKVFCKGFSLYLTSGNSKSPSMFAIVPAHGTELIEDRGFLLSRGMLILQEDRRHILSF